ncbi:MAG TPA: DUF3597 domain-containing protein [Thermoanaerobaculia bacterium]|nr:DUF3597 domain-containing protein [Thermoanaerobaculia bacterium]
MGMFGDLMDKIFRRGANAERPHDAAPWTAGGGTSPAAVATAPAATQPQVDVEAVLNKLAAENPEKLDWRHSIVDLMKLVGMDSSLANRKELAAELNYTGDTNDSAAMNIWLHKQVMKKLAENGGKVPADLLD